MINVKNGRAGMAVAVDDEDEASGKNALPSRPKGHKSTKTDLKRNASALALRDTLKTMIDETQEALSNRDEKRRPEKDIPAAIFTDLAKQAIEV
jgi:hypothetical protein